MADCTVAAVPDFRQLTPADDRATVELMFTAFSDLDRRLGRQVHPPPPAEAGMARVRHLATTDPEGAWAVEEDGELVGAAQSIVREGVWGLSLLVVHPRMQGSGIGRELMARSLRTMAGTRGGIILSSEDPRAMRLYFRSGFALRPTLDARGAPVRRPAAPETVRPVRWPEDSGIVDAAGRYVRGAGHGTDVPAMLEGGNEVLVHDRGGFVVHRAGEVKALAAHDDDTAADLLRAAINGTPPGGNASVEFISAGHDWAVGVVLDAGMELIGGGAIFVRGELGPMAPYLPSGAYL
jgi:GNAT superfamily N-acetyltransferase